METDDLTPTATRDELLAAAKEAVTSPGVYLMKDPKGGILYVGKAKNLRNRLVTYFKSQVHEMPRIELMVSRVQRFDVMLTETETDALILECNLIKKHKPRFNVRLKDDKAYPYIRVAFQDAHPRLEWTRRLKRDGARYYGPFPSAWAARQVMQLLTETFKLRDCSDNTFRHRSRPCILHSIGRCSAPCVGLISEADYKATVREAADVLEGKGDRLQQSLERAMLEASEREEYQEAAIFRDQLRNIQLVTETQSVVEAGQERNRDVVGLFRDGDHANASVLQIRGGKLLAVRHLTLQNADPAVPDLEIVEEFLTQFYVEIESKRAIDEVDPDGGPSAIVRAHPREILVHCAPEEVGALERYIGAVVRTPDGPEEQKLLQVAGDHAKGALKGRKAREGGHGIKALEDIQYKLHLHKLPQRIECYDISNIQGQDAVASRVVFVDGAPDKNLYRRYKIRTVEGSNDFAMMKEVLGRRFSNVEESLPELVVVDGGKGQLSQAVAILEELDVQGVAVVGLAKARTESDFESSEVHSSHERIFIPGRKNPVNLLPHTEAYKLLVHVRDEAHRFAVSYHRLLRKKRTLGEGS